MVRRKVVGGVVLALMLAAGALLAVALSAMAPSATAAQAHGTATPRHSLLRSRELWATIDVCNPAKEPDTVGIRGSMPNDGHEKDAMYMRFQLEYMDPKSKTWSRPCARRGLGVHRAGGGEDGTPGRQQLSARRAEGPAGVHDAGHRDVPVAPGWKGRALGDTDDERRPHERREGRPAGVQRGRMHYPLTAY